MNKVSVLLSIALLINGCLAVPQQQKVDGSTVIAHRFNGNLNFFRSWKEYKHGFEDETGEFFIGLEKVHKITASGQHELIFELEDFEGETRTESYDDFKIADESDKYRLISIGQAAGTAGNCLNYNLGMQFSTYDSKNDISRGNCPNFQMGAWWYNDCSYVNPFGLYLSGKYSTDFIRKGMYWYSWKGETYSYKTLKMMLRPVTSK